MEPTITTNEPDIIPGKFNLNTEGKGIFTLSVAFDEEVKKELGGMKMILTDVESYLTKTFFPIVSLILERATYGQHQLGKIQIHETNSDNTDILITQYSTNVYGRIWNVGQIEFSIDHIYSPGLMLHELGHYLYHLGDEYAGCKKSRFGTDKSGNPASIMEYSFGNNTRFKRKDQEREYKVLEGGGFNEFWNDRSSGNFEFLYKTGEVVTDFCTEANVVVNGQSIKHDPLSRSEQNIVHEDEIGKGRSCWAVMLDDSVGGETRGAAFEYNLEDPFDLNFNSSQFRSREKVEGDLAKFEQFFLTNN